jgi:hypothetical protein
VLVLLICKPTNKKKFKIQKRGNGRRKVVRGHVGASAMVGQSLGDGNKGDGWKVEVRGIRR